MIPICKLLEMAFIFSMLMIGVALAISGCGFLPFFTSEGTVRNPVPKPDIEQTDLGNEARTGKNDEKEKTPSLVLLPENRRNINAVGPRERKVSGMAGDPMFTGFGDCLASGYALLDGVECTPASEEPSDTAVVVDSHNYTSSALGSDLLGNRTVIEPSEAPDEVVEKVQEAVSIAEIPERDNPNQRQSPSASPMYPPAEVFLKPQPARLIPASYERIILTSDVLFQFAKFNLDDVSEVGQIALQGLLDRFAQYDKTSLRKVIITGHSDRLGAQATNLKLSEQRAFSIKAFLIGAGIDADILETAGVGAVSPIKHCVGKTNSAKLKSCLAPNRRVEIEIIGVT